MRNSKGPLRSHSAKVDVFWLLCCGESLSPWKRGGSWTCLPPSFRRIYFVHFARFAYKLLKGYKKVHNWPESLWKRKPRNIIYFLSQNSIWIYSDGERNFSILACFSFTHVPIFHFVLRVLNCCDFETDYVKIYHTSWGS